MHALFNQIPRWGHALIVLLIAILLYCFALSPRSFPLNKSVSVNPGSSLLEISENLAEQEIIKSPFIFRSLVRLAGAADKLQAGDYWFERRLTVWSVAARLARGQFVAKPIKVTIPEGLNAKQLGSLLSEKFPHLAEPAQGDESRWSDLLSERLGELMPDTYFWPPEIALERLLETMRANFARQTRDLRAAAVLRGRAWSDILVLASLVEEEVSDPADRRLVAGLLWKRLDTGMRLQVDVAPETYEREGLPAQPIANISLDALEAVVYPEESEFWYYISSPDGVTHYAETFEEHKQNIRKYL